MFVNTLAIRTSLRGTPSFRVLLERVKECSLAAFDHQDVPFERVVGALNPARDLSRTPIIQSLFRLHNTPTAEASWPELDVRFEPVDHEVALFDVSLDVFEQPRAGYQARLEYETDLFDRSTAERMAEHFGVVLEAALDAPDTSVALLPLMSDAERRRLLVEWNATERAFDETPVHTGVERHAAESPHAVAVSMGDREWTYGEVNRRANQLARTLRRRGIGDDSRVGTLFLRSEEMIIAQLAVLKAGAAYVPLDSSHPAARLSFMVADVGATLVLSTRDVSSRFDMPVELLVLDAPDVAEEIAREGTDDLALSCGPNQAAYVIYTSGTTGRPKGALVEHRSLANLVSHHLRLIDGARSDRVSQLVSPGFDGTMNEIWPTLTSGATLVIADDEVRRSPADLAAWIRERAITVAYMTTPLAESILDEDWSGAKLRVLLTGGQALQRRPRGGEPFRLVNIYGPTEATDYVTSEDVEPGEKSVTTIGRPIQNTAIYVLDTSGAPTPIGVFGEIHIGGVNVGRGYVGRPFLTAERFGPDPHAAGPGARLYRTGDRGRWLADGRIEFGGRNDDQVKVRGYRIELGEVEAAVTSLAGIERAVVLAREDVPGDKRLVAYVVPAAGTTVSTEALKSALATSLPSYMVPSAFVVLAALPLTANAKVDKKALPAPDFRVAANEYVVPRTPTEHALAEVFQQILAVSRVGVRDDFFALGGDSLLAVRAVRRIHALLGASVAVRVMFEAPTIRELAERIDGESTAPSSRRLKPTQRNARSPLSYNQLLWWRRQAHRPDYPGFNTVNACRLAGALDADVLARSVVEVIRRHDVLRTAFELDASGEPELVVHEPGEDGLEQIDMPAASLESVVAMLRERHHERPQLVGATVPRFLLVRLGDDDHVLALLAHRIVLDPLLSETVLAEARTLYEAFLDGKPSPLPEPMVRYADFVAWQRQMTERPDVRERIATRRQALAGAQRLALPFDHPVPEQPGPLVRQVPVPMTPSTWGAIDELARSSKTTQFVVLSALLKAFLSQVTGQTDIALISPHELARGLEASLGSVIGCFADYFILRTDLSGNPSLREIIRRERPVLLAAQRDVDLPSVLVTDDYVEGPLFSVALNTIGAGRPSERLEVLPTRLTASGVPAFRHRMVDLAWAVFGVNGSLFASADRFDEPTVARLAKELTAFLERAVSAPDAPLGR